MSAGWRWEPERLRAELEALGYDVDVSDPALVEGGGALTARRERSGRSLVAVIDAGGRFRATLTGVVDESRWAESVAGVPLRAVAETRWSLTVGGELVAIEQVTPLVAAVERMALR